mmetsp:Transcript_94356/g.252448  ORF Transcript_94356/g.252448 Transcript_94356/m.252448 type:complete len:370 (+) Transcript_94356:6-1115(+)
MCACQAASPATTTAKAAPHSPKTAAASHMNPIAGKMLPRQPQQKNCHSTDIYGHQRSGRGQHVPIRKRHMKQEQVKPPFDEAKRHVQGLLGPIRCLVNPTHSDTVPPLTCLLVTVRSAKLPDTMLFAIFPLTCKFSIVSPRECPFPLLEVIHILSFIGSPVRPFIATFSVHSIVDPLALVLSSILPCEDSVAFHVVVSELPFVDAAIRPFKLSSAMLLTIEILACVFAGILPFFHCLPVLQIILPFTDVLGLLRSVGAMTLGFSVHPLSVVGVSVRVAESSLSVLVPIFPLAFISAAIWKDLIVVPFTTYLGPLRCIGLALTSFANSDMLPRQVNPVSVSSKLRFRATLGPHIKATRRRSSVPTGKHNT